MSRGRLRAFSRLSDAVSRRGGAEHPRVRAVCGLLLLSASVLSLVDGCSLVGAIGGSQMDRTIVDRHSVEAWQLDTLSLGKQIEIVRSDDSVVSGAYQGVIRNTIEEYKERFGRFLADLPGRAPFPVPGDSILLINSKGFGDSLELLAYDYSSIVARKAGGEVVTTEAREFTEIGWSGEIRPGRQLWSWIRSSRAPLFSSIKVLAERHLGLGQYGNPVDIRVPLDEVQQIRFKTTRTGNYALAGFLVGLTFDAMIVTIILLASDDSPEPPPPSTDGSCPYLYSYDGREYRLDAETFSGAIFKALQETDSVVLDHLVAQDGVCRVKIANRLPETQFVDALTMIAVDHPRGSEVIPGGPDRFRTISAPQPPLLATTLDGKGATRLVAERDSTFWISNPAGRDVDDPASLRDGLILRFGRPSGAQEVKLLFTLRNTPWLIELEHHLLELTGPMLDVWYAHMHLFSGHRKEFREALYREAGLRVDLWNGRGWQPMGHLPFVGPAVSRTMIFPVDLGEAGPGDLLVRIESTPGLWMVDRVQADFTEDLPVHLVQIATRSALTGRGEDVQEALAAIDEEYFKLEQGDEAEVRFEQTPIRNGEDRTYIARCTGYYTVDVHPRAQTKVALLRRLAQEPGAFGVYTVSLINDWLDGASASENEAMVASP